MEICLPEEGFLINHWWRCLSKGPIKYTCSKLRYKTMCFLMKIINQPSVMHGVRANYPPAGPLAVILPYPIPGDSSTLAPRCCSGLQPQPLLSPSCLHSSSHSGNFWLGDDDAHKRSCLPVLCSPQGWKSNGSLLLPSFWQSAGGYSSWDERSVLLDKGRGLWWVFFFPCTYLKLFLFLFPPCDGTGSQ